jgi:DNA-binding LacI/PurR family transcriptional regulator
LAALLQRRLPPTAFLVSGPKYVLTTLGFLTQAGLRLPHDAALISRDDESFLDFGVPTIARYSTDPMLFARKVSRTVLKLAQGAPMQSSDYRVMPKFIQGQTCN